MIPDITQKIDNWLRYATAGQRGVLVEAKEEIERLREALKDIDGQMRQADRYFLKESTLAALHQKESGQ